MFACLAAGLSRDFKRCLDCSNGRFQGRPFVKVVVIDGSLGNVLSKLLILLY